MTWLQSRQLFQRNVWQPGPEPEAREQESGTREQESMMAQILIHKKMVSGVTTTLKNLGFVASHSDRGVEFEGKEQDVKAFVRGLNKMFNPD